MNRVDWAHGCSQSAEVLDVDLEALLWVGLIEGGQKGVSFML